MSNAKKVEREQAVAAIVVAFILLFGVTPALVLAAWNVGIVPLILACGGQVAGIGYLDAVGLTFALGLAKGLVAAGRTK